MHAHAHELRLSLLCNRQFLMWLTTILWMAGGEGSEWLQCVGGLECDESCLARQVSCVRGRSSWQLAKTAIEVTCKKIFRCAAIGLLVCRPSSEAMANDSPSTPVATIRIGLQATAQHHDLNTKHSVVFARCRSFGNWMEGNERTKEW